MADQIALSRNDPAAYKLEAEKRMAQIDALPDELRPLVWEYHHVPVLWAVKHLGGDPARVAAHCHRLQRQGQSQLLRSIVGLGAQIAKTMRGKR